MFKFVIKWSSVVIASSTFRPIRVAHIRNRGKYILDVESGDISFECYSR